MKFIQLTAKRFQFITADSIYISKLAENFSKILGRDYVLVVGDMLKGQFKGINTVNLNLLSWGTGLVYFLWPYFFYFFWLPYFLVFKLKNKNEMAFFLSDPNILCILIFWKKIFQMEFKIISDWHMLHNDWKDKFICRGSDNFITTSNKLKKLLVSKLGADKKKITTVYGGVDLGSFEGIAGSDIRSDLGLPRNKKVAAYVGLFKTMGMEKGIDTMVKSAKFLEDNIILLFVGGKSSEIAEYKILAQKIGVLDKCFFVEKIADQDQVYKIEQVVDALVIPYPDKPHFREYGFPMKVYEYMAAKRPIIYSKLDLTEEVLSDCGFLFTPDDPKSLAVTLNYVLAESSKVEVEYKIALAYNKLKSFTWESKARKILKSYERHE